MIFASSLIYVFLCPRTFIRESQWPKQSSTSSAESASSISQNALPTENRFRGPWIVTDLGTRRVQGTEFVCLCAVILSMPWWALGSYELSAPTHHTPPPSSDNCVFRLWFSFLIGTRQLHQNWRLIQIPNSLDPSLSLLCRSFQTLPPIT